MLELSKFLYRISVRICDAYHTGMRGKLLQSKTKKDGRIQKNYFKVMLNMGFVVNFWAKKTTAGNLSSQYTIPTLNSCFLQM